MLKLLSLLMFTVCATVGISAPTPQLEYDMCSASSELSIPADTSALITARSPVPGKVYTIQFAGGRLGVAYRVEWRSAAYASASGFSANQSDGFYSTTLLDAARGGSAPPAFTTGVSCTLMMTFYANAEELGEGPSFVVWAFKVSSPGAPKLSRGRAQPLCSPLDSCSRCLSVPGCSWCADNRLRRSGVCQWSGIGAEASATSIGRAAFQTLAAPPWSCLMNATFARTCNNASLVQAPEKLKTNGAAAANATDYTHALSPLDAAFQHLDPAPLVPEATSGAAARFPIYGALIGVSHLVTFSLIALIATKSQAASGARAVSRPLAEYTSLALLLALSVQLYSCLLLDGAASFHVQETRRLLNDEMQLAVAPDEATAAALALGSLDFPQASLLASAVPLLRPLALISGDAVLLLTPILVHAALPKKILSAIKLRLGSQKDKGGGLLDFLGPAVVGLVIAAMSHVTRWTAFVALRAGGSSLEATLSAIAAAKPIPLATPNVVPVRLFLFCEATTMIPRADGGVSALSASQWFPLFFSLAAFMMMCVCAFGVVEMLSGIARRDKESITPIKPSPALFLSLGANIVALALPATVLGTWVQQCSRSPDNHAAADSILFAAAISTPSAVVIIGTVVVTFASAWQSVLDATPPTAEISEGILLDPGVGDVADDGEVLDAAVPQRPTPPRSALASPSPAK
jgi:hypothetical protein